MTLTYPAVFQPHKDGSFDGYFPDLEGGARFHGSDIDDAINHAIEALHDWIDVQIEDNEEMPLLSDEGDITLKDGEFIRSVSAIVHLGVGYY